MRIVRWNICAVLMALSALLSIGSAWAEDLSAPNLSIKLDDARPLDTGAAPQSLEDIPFRTSDKPMVASLINEVRRLNCVRAQ